MELSSLKTLCHFSVLLIVEVLLTALMMLGNDLNLRVIHFERTVAS